MNMVSLFSLKSSGHREGVPVSGRFTSMTLPRREAARDSSILIDRSWAMIKDWRNTDDGATYYAHMTDKFFENIATLPQAVTDFFASAVDDSKGETNFDLFVWLVREANEHAAKRKKHVSVDEHQGPSVQVWQAWLFQRDESRGPGGHRNSLSFGPAVCGGGFCAHRRQARHDRTRLGLQLTNGDKQDAQSLSAPATAITVLQR
mmetsp:Transcript_5656/g.7891  ORF Transcript_5656/g.7891 Transcript_5656/m.7891 type:complete len:204 (-) Transcript_5656:118-729(-)